LTVPHPDWVGKRNAEGTSKEHGMFAKDRDIAQVEPNVFRDFVWLGQVVSRGTASVSGTALEASAQDNSFVGNAIEMGYVVTIGGVSLEVIDVLGPTFLSVSRLREDAIATARPAALIASSPFHMMTFRPQLEWVHRQLLAMLGVGRFTNQDQVYLPESRIKNPWELVRAEVYGALHLIYAAAGSALASDHPLNQRASLYRQMFRDERMRVVVQIDLDGDGTPDVLRRMNVGQLVRL
jgi:hypothetical protein